MPGIILYGPPASGKDTVSRELEKLDGRYCLFERLKSGTGRTCGYRMTTDSALEELRANGDVVWENRRYGASYVVDRPSIIQSLKTGVPILHLGQVEAVKAVVCATSGERWVVVSLWCPREVATARLIGRGSTDLEARLRAWDETAPLPGSDLTVNTAEISPEEVARVIDSQMGHRSSTAPT